MVKPLLSLVGHLLLLAVILSIAFVVYVLSIVRVIEVPWLAGVVSDEDSAPAINWEPAAQEYIVALFNRDVSDDGRFDIVISELEANGLLNVVLGPGAPIQNLAADFRPNAVRLSGELRGRLPVPFQATLSPSIVEGGAQIVATDVLIAMFPVPGFGSEDMSVFANDLLDINRVLAEQADVELEIFEISHDEMRLVGKASGPIRLADGEAPGVMSGPPPVVPRPRAQADVRMPVHPVPDAWKYIALGDSLTAGDGATDPSRKFAVRFHQYLNQTYGVPIRFENLAVSGEDSIGFQDGGHSQIDRAIQIIEGIKVDSNPNSRVHIITITMGANDIFPVLQGPTCFAMPTSADCQSLIDETVALYEARMQKAMSRLVAAVEPNTIILYANCYNPFDLGTDLIFQTVAQQAVDRVNEASERVAMAHGAATVEVGLLFDDLAFGITRIAAGDIHPNDEGHGVATRAFQDAYEAIMVDR